MEDVSEFYPFSLPDHYHPDCPLNDYENQIEVCQLYIVIIQEHTHDIQLHEHTLYMHNVCVCVYNYYACIRHIYKVENCRLAGLPDLDQSNKIVRTILTTWAKRTVSKYDFDGLRVDTAHMVPKDFWKDYSASAGVFTIGEVFNDNPQYVSSYQVNVSADVLYQ